MTQPIFAGVGQGSPD